MAQRFETVVRRNDDGKFGLWRHLLQQRSDGGDDRLAQRCELLRTRAFGFPQAHGRNAIRRPLLRVQAKVAVFEQDYRRPARRACDVRRTGIDRHDAAGSFRRPRPIAKNERPPMTRSAQPASRACWAAAAASSPYVTTTGSPMRRRAAISLDRCAERAAVAQPAFAQVERDRAARHRRDRGPLRFAHRHDQLVPQLGRAGQFDQAQELVDFVPHARAR